MRRGHSLKDIGDYTLAQFEMFLAAADEVEAEERSAFVTDMSVVVGSLFSKEDPAGEHLFLLRETAAGVKHGDSR